MCDRAFYHISTVLVLCEGGCTGSRGSPDRQAMHRAGGLRHHWHEDNQVCPDRRHLALGQAGCGASAWLQTCQVNGVLRCMTANYPLQTSPSPHSRVRCTGHCSGPYSLVSCATASCLVPHPDVVCHSLVSCATASCLVPHPDVVCHSLVSYATASDVPCHSPLSHATARCPMPQPAVPRTCMCKQRCFRVAAEVLSLHNYGLSCRA